MTPAASTAQAEQTEQALRSYLDSLLTGDLGRIRTHFAADATWTLHGTLPIAGTHTGADAIMEFLVAAGSLYRPGSDEFRFGDIVAAGDTAVLEWNVTGIGTATGERYDNDYCGVFVIRGGRIVEVREYLDSDHARSVLFGA